MSMAFRTLVELIEKVSGNVIPERNLSRLEQTVRSRVIVTNLFDFEEYIALLVRDQDGDEWRQLLSLITVNESYLFRTPYQFQALQEKVIPDLVSRREPPKFHLWSAGGARGEEACTLAIICAECAQLAGWDWRILATDVDDAALKDARRALYCERAVSKVPPALLQKYFTKRGENYEFSPILLERISYQHVNLVREPLGVDKNDFAIIFFRNVLIYFRPESQERVAKAVARTMADDGYLFLGGSESLWQLYPDLEPIDLGNCFTYRWARRRPVKEDVPEISDAWQKLEESTGKFAVIPSLKPKSPVTDEKPRDETEINIKAARAAVVDALKDGLFDEARGMVTDATGSHPEDAILRALEGLCFDLIDALTAAAKAYRASLYLDPSLYQVRFLLAKSLEKLGQKDRARREYQAVLVQIGRPGAHEFPLAIDVGLPQRQLIRVQCLAKTRL